MPSISTEFLVPATLWVLLGLSVLTWTVILVKLLQHWRVGRDNRRFRKAFWGAPSLQAAADLDDHDGPSSRLAQQGFETLRDDAHRVSDLEHTGERQDLLERALRQQIQRERRRLESGLALLASIGSTAPFIGLFGTVIGIMHALTEIGRTGSASLDVVAGPIGEALIATGVGIAVAVPAVLAYNVFLRRLKLSAADLDDFGADLIRLARKAGFRIAGASAAESPAGAGSLNKLPGRAATSAASSLNGAYA